MKGAAVRIEDIRRVLVVGGGTMGRQISLQCATHGYDVSLYDIAPEALEAATVDFGAFADHLVTWGRLTREDADAALARIATTTDAGEAAADSDIVSESIPEDPALKGRVFAQFNGLCPERTVFTTNTSDLLPSMFAEATGRPDRFAAFHFHQHVWESNVVDIMPHPGTSPETVELLRAFAARIGQIPIVLSRESPGYVFNAMLNGLLSAAMNLAAGGVATVEDIDLAWTGVTKMIVGPFGILDVIGLDLACHITESIAEASGDPGIRAQAEFLRGYVDRGCLGIKSGRGFYEYA
jgi:3-hydroxybutyryl-CoA dehydrogenase